MSKTVILLRPFTFSYPSAGGEHHRLPRDEKFTPLRDKETGGWLPTEQELPDDVANHSFITEHFADGCIERPEATKARMEAAQAKVDKAKQDNARELQKAEDALKRATGSHAVHKVTESKVTSELNTPVNEIGAKQGADVDKAVDDKDLQLALNTPVNKLAAGKK